MYKPISLLDQEITRVMLYKAKFFIHVRDFEILSHYKNEEIYSNFLL